MPIPGKKKKGKSVPSALSGSPLSEPENPVPEAMGPPPSSSNKPDASAQGDFFPLPGETAESDDWAKAFTLGPSQLPTGGVPVAGKSTLWRKIPVPAPAPAATVAIESSDSMLPVDIQRRFDALTRQLDSLTSATPGQSTAELFLFIAIGLLFLLAMDTLLRCATTVALLQRKQSGGALWRQFRKAWGR